MPDDGNCIGYSWCILAAYHHIEIFRYAAVSANAELGYPKTGGGDVQHLRKKKTWSCVAECCQMHQSTLVVWNAKERSNLGG